MKQVFLSICLCCLCCIAANAQWGGSTVQVVQFFSILDKEEEPPTTTVSPPIRKIASVYGVIEAYQTNNSLQVYSIASASANTRIEVRNSNGVLVYAANVSSASANNLTVDTSNWQEGQYTISIKKN